MGPLFLSRLRIAFGSPAPRSLPSPPPFGAAEASTRATDAAAARDLRGWQVRMYVGSYCWLVG
jgi:hypothetical protein